MSAIRTAAALLPATLILTCLPAVADGQTAVPTTVATPASNFASEMAQPSAPRSVPNATLHPAARPALQTTTAGNTTDTGGEMPTDRVDQQTGISGYSLDSTSAAHTLTMSFATPTLACGSGQAPFPFPWQSNISGTEAAIGLYSGVGGIEMFFPCSGKSVGYGAVGSTFNTDCAGVGSFDEHCPVLRMDKTVNPGDVIDMQVSANADGSGTASITDEATGSNLSYSNVVRATTTPQLNFLMEDYCNFGSSLTPCINTLAGGEANTIPPLWDFYSQLDITNATVDGAPLADALGSSDLSDWQHYDAVYGATLFDEVSNVAGETFTVTNSNRPLPVANVTAGPGVDISNSPATIPFTVKLSFASTDQIYLDYSTTGGSAIDGQNFIGTSGTLSFPPGLTSQTIDVTVLPGEASGGSISFVLGVFNASLVVPGDLGVGAIYQGPNISSVSPTSVPTAGGNTVTIQGFDFGPSGTQDTVMFCNAVGVYPSSNCVAGLAATVQSDNEITATTPDASHLVGSNATFAKADTVVTNPKGIASPKVSGDLIQFGCSQIVGNLGQYGYSACVTDTSDPNVQATEQQFDLEGLLISASAQAAVDFADAAGGAVTSTGSQTVSLVIAGQKVVLANGPLNLNGAGPMTFTPATKTIAQFKVNGALTLTPGPGHSATGSLPVIGPDWLGRPTGTMTFTTRLGGGSVTNLQVALDPGVFGNLFSLGTSSLSYNQGAWTFSSTATAGPNSSTAEPLNGTFTLSGTTLTTASFQIVGAFPLLGMIAVGGFSITYAPGIGWSGTAAALGSNFAGITASFVADATGAITSGIITASTGLLLGEIAVASVTFTLTGSTWKVDTQLPAGAAATSFIQTSLTVSKGVVTAGSITAKKVELAGGFQFGAKITYSFANNTSVWTNVGSITMPNTQVSSGTLKGIDVGFTVINGVPSGANITFKGSIPLSDGFFLTQLGAGVAWNPQFALTNVSVGGAFGPEIAGQRLITVVGSYTRQTPPVVPLGSQIIQADFSVLDTKLGSGSLTLNDDFTDAVSITLGEGGTIGLQEGKLNVIGTLTGSIAADNTFTLTGNATIAFAGHTLFSATLFANAYGMAACTASGAGVHWVWTGSPRWLKAGCSTTNF